MSTTRNTSKKLPSSKRVKAVVRGKTGRFVSKVFAADSISRNLNRAYAVAAAQLEAQAIAKGIKQGLEEVRLIHEGKIKPQSVDDLLNEL